MPASVILNAARRMPNSAIFRQNPLHVPVAIGDVDALFGGQYCSRELGVWMRSPPTVVGRRRTRIRVLNENVLGDRQIPRRRFRQIDVGRVARRD